MDEKLTKILDGRTLPSKVKSALSKLISKKDDRVKTAFDHKDEKDIKISEVVKPAIDDLFPTWESCYEGCTVQQAKQISCAERSKVKGLGSINLTYGEVKFESLASALSCHCDMKSKNIFYDVGSGSGRGVFCAALCHDFKKLVGLEIVPGLNTAAQRQLEHYKTVVLPKLTEEAKTEGKNLTPQEIEFKCEDFRKVDWSEADVVWANSTCFGTDLMAHLSRYSEKMDINTYFITLTQKLQSKHWELINGGELMPMSWGSATIYVWKKIKPPNKEIGDPAAELAAAEKEKEKETEKEKTA